MHRQALVLGIVVATFSGCARTPPVDSAAETAAVRQQFAAWVEAETRRDLESALSFMAPDIVIQPKGGACS